MITIVLLILPVTTILTTTAGWSNKMIRPSCSEVTAFLVTIQSVSPIKSTYILTFNII